MTRVRALLRALELQVDLADQIGREQLDLPSRCTGWSIHQVLDHSLRVTHKLADFASGVTDEPHSPRSSDLIGRDHSAAVAREAEYARRAWNEVDMTRTCRLPFGSFSAKSVAGINLFDVLAHNWDMSTCASLGLTEDDPLWLAGLNAAQEIIGPFRDPDHYAPELPIAGDAPPMLRFLAFLGRSPGGNSP